MFLPSTKSGWERKSRRPSLFAWVAGEQNTADPISPKVSSCNSDHVSFKRYDVMHASSCKNVGKQCEEHMSLTKCSWLLREYCPPYQVNHVVRREVGVRSIDYQWGNQRWMAEERSGPSMKNFPIGRGPHEFRLMKIFFWSMSRYLRS